MGMIVREPEKKKRERAPAVKAQILTRRMIAEGLRQVKGNCGGP